MNELIKTHIEKCSARFAEIDAAALHNQKKVLDAFRKNRVALRHFNGTSGYGYDDEGRGNLARVFADVFHTEKAIVSPLLTSGTHAITVALFGLVKSGDVILSITGTPYDTLHGVINGANGSLADYGVKFYSVPLSDGKIDCDKVTEAIKKYCPSVIYIQRSRGYEWRDAFSTEDIFKAVQCVRSVTDACIAVDNCYGEFVETSEPTDAGADVVIGSLIKNPGGSIAPTGGYIAGKTKYIDKIAGRLTAPTVGTEVGSYAAGYRTFYQGLFLAPHVVAQSLKTAVLFSSVLGSLGYDVKPLPDEKFYDIVCSIRFGEKQKLIDFVQAIQYVSPVDSYVTPEPWDMPGYDDEVIMAAGCFVQGASIELSCDGPVRPPYIAYLQGGITFEHGIIALEKVLENLNK